MFLWAVKVQTSGQQCCKDCRLHFYSMRYLLAAFESKSEMFKQFGELVWCVFNKDTGGLSKISSVGLKCRSYKSFSLLFSVL